MAKVMKHLQMEIDIQDNTNSVNLMVKEDIYGQTEIIMKANSSMDLEKEEES